ncbi:hypothetical protein [Uliginosibacterium aquaticum]|uniref:DUF3325 domain-containing protein n=1 Tax=Uliginosibacterium aquaticum TaxID=2731212 RepID=A0ABX2IK86_9RHOO|nr:hypothetical protein [Uliginosibacterium aquaticum]NSL54460.1 hypothetical protein [Uliginosibacterium aquaticum]
MLGWLLSGLLLALAGSFAIHLASPHQRWRASALAARPARLAGAALLVAALIALGQALHSVVAVFVLLTWLMLAFVLLPYLGALIARKESR